MWLVILMMRLILPINTQALRIYEGSANGSSANIKLSLNSLR